MSASLINFEWPTQHQFDLMSSNARLQSLEFGYHDAISSVRCTLSDTNSSPVFAHKGTLHESPKTIAFNANNPVRYIRASETRDCVQQIYFLDQHKNVIDGYDPFSIGNFGREIELRTSEEIVGVYGVVDKRDWLTSFGFITKMRNSAATE